MPRSTGQQRDVFSIGLFKGCYSPQGTDENDLSIPQHYLIFGTICVQLPPQDKEKYKGHYFNTKSRDEINALIEQYRRDSLLRKFDLV